MSIDFEANDAGQLNVNWLHTSSSSGLCPSTGHELCNVNRSRLHALCS